MALEVLTWDERYRQKGREPYSGPSVFLEEVLPFLTRGRALDVPCGQGRDSIFLAQNGFVVDAVDISREGLRQLNSEARSLGLHIRTAQADIIDWLENKNEEYNLIISFNYLNREAMPLMERALVPGGRIVLETFNTDHAKYNFYRGPRDGRFLLKPGELPSLLPNCITVKYREGVVKRRKWYMSKVCYLGVKR
ncbi:MAG: methyltransferase domain-containing protein [Chloroflexi bacterium]|nr:methyltransferase domain-containing protein [Chloroflexota bacterium]